jgi:hypothetical protein
MKVWENNSRMTCIIINIVYPTKNKKNLMIVLRK